MHRRNGDVPANTLPGFVNPRRNWPGWDTHLLARDSQLPFSSVFVLENMFVLSRFIAGCWMMERRGNWYRYFYDLDHVRFSFSSIFD